MGLDQQIAEAIRREVEVARQALELKQTNKLNDISHQTRDKFAAQGRKFTAIERNLERLKSHVESEQGLDASKFERLNERLEPVRKLIEGGDIKEPLQVRLSTLEADNARLKAKMDSRSSFCMDIGKQLIAAALIWLAAAAVWVSGSMENSEEAAPVPVRVEKKK